MSPRFWARIVCFSLSLSCCGLTEGQDFKHSSDTTTTKSPETVVAEFKHNGGKIKSIAEVVAQAADGCKMLLTPDGQLWAVGRDDMVGCEPHSQPMVPLSQKDIYEDFKQQGAVAGFQVHQTPHFVLIYDTNEAYAHWVGQLYEQLYRGFHNFWKTQGFKLQEARFPLVAVVFKTREAYLAYAERHIGPAAKALMGYYDPQSNRMITYDMTGAASVPTGSRSKDQQLIAKLLLQPGAERTVATIVHEAVHQLAYNTGLQVRRAENPTWLSEGLALYFETPDANSPIGWRAIGKPNLFNMRNFIQFIPQRPNNSLLTLISDDSRLQKEETASHAYAESWALTYFMIKKKRDAFVGYVKELSQMTPGQTMSPPERVKLFQKHFGEDMNELDRDFIKYMSSLQSR